MIVLLIICGYLVLLLTLGIGASLFFRGTKSDYTLASQSIGPVLLLLSLFGTTMTAFALVGSTAKSYELGVGVFAMLASASAIVHPLCFFLVGVKLYAWGRRFGYSTQIEFFRDRLQSEAIGVLLFPLLVILVIQYLLAGVLGAGITIHAATRGAFASVGWFGPDHGVPSWLGGLVVCVVVLFYVFLGGMRGTAWANAFQTLLFMVLGVITFCTVAQGIGGQDSLVGSLEVATRQVAESEKATHLSREKLPASVYFSFLLIPFSVAMFPHVFQHWLTAKSANSFKLPIVVHPIFIMIVWLPCVLLGVWATGVADLTLPPKPDGSANTNAVLSVLVNMFATPKYPWLAGLLTAGILAAIMSSLDSQFLCMGTLFTEDVVLRWTGRQLSQRTMVIIARSFVIGVVAVTYVLSLFPPPNIFDLGVWSFSGFVALVPLVIACLYWRGTTAVGAMASVVVTVCCWTAMFVASDFATQRYAFPPEPLQVGDFTLIPPLMPVVSLTVASTLTLIIVSLITPKPPEHVLNRFFPPAQ